MIVLEPIFGIIATIIVMEGIVTLIHRHIMHGIGWHLHRSHHVERLGGLELNDFYSIGFSALGFVLFVLGAKIGGILLWIAIGYSIYGLLYFLVHDGLVHGRLAIAWRPRSGYLHRLIAAHYIHHRSDGRLPAISCGFLYAPPLERLRRASREQT
jgi:beta-carotene 3-hydroxylase